MFPYSKHLQTIGPSFLTIIKLLRNKIAETFCEGLKCMCKPFELDGQKDLYRPAIFGIL